MGSWTFPFNRSVGAGLNFCIGTRPWGMLAALGLLALPPAAASAAPSIKVEMEAPTIEYRTFEPDHPPPILQQAPGQEAAFCQTRLELLSMISAEGPRFFSSRAGAKITSVDVTTRLRIVIWTPQGGPPNFMAHEETHRAISEHYYRRAGEVARRLVTPLVGRKLDLPSRKTRAQFEDALRPIKERLNADFMRETLRRIEFAQDRFDTITDHGRDPITNETAMTQAIADEELNWSTAPNGVPI